MLQLHDPITGLVTARHETPNLITTSGKNLIARMLLDRPNYDTGLTYQALGTGTIPARNNDSVLGAELTRREILNRGDTTTNIAAFFSFFPATDVSVQINEVGIFGHFTASAATDSGVLFSRALLSINNTNGQDLQIVYVLRIG